MLWRILKLISIDLFLIFFLIAFIGWVLTLIFSTFLKLSFQVTIIRSLSSHRQTGALISQSSYVAYVVCSALKHRWWIFFVWYCCMNKQEWYRSDSCQVQHAPSMPLANFFPSHLSSRRVSLGFVAKFH